MTKKFTFILLAIVLCTSLCSATPLRREHVPAGAQWVFHADFDAFRSSEIGTLIQQNIIRDHKEKIDALTQLLGTDLTQDIYGVTLYGSEPGDKNASALFYGTFAKDKLLTLLRLNKAYAESDYNGRTLYYWVDDKRKKDQVGAFAADGLIVIGQKESCVITALDVLSGRIEPLSQHKDAPLYSLCNVSSSTFVLAAAVGVSDLVRDDQHAAILKNSHVLAIAGFEDSGLVNLTINLETETEAAAEQVEQVVRGMMAFASLSQQEHPQIAPLLQAGTLSREGSKLAYRFEYPSGKLFDVLKSFRNKKM